MWEEEGWEHVLWWCRRREEGLEETKKTQERVKEILAGETEPGKGG